MSKSDSPSSTVGEKTLAINEVTLDGTTSRSDCVVVEEPMEIRVVFGPAQNRSMRSLSVTMRTPGNDEELAAGFLFTEGILDSDQQIDQIQARGVDSDGADTGNIIRVDLNPNVDLDFDRLQRHFFTTSSCGVCGKASLDALRVRGLQPVDSDSLQIPSRTVHAMPALLRSGQSSFDRTGGLHAAAFCQSAGVSQNLNLSFLREDVGRHNAVDKLIGRFFLDGQTPVSNYVMIISGRASFEIMQKALVAGVPMIVAVGAPSSLAVDMAKHYNITLVGFASENRFNIYSAPHRILNQI